MFNPDLKRGSMELLILTILEGRPRHGYEIGKALERRSNGMLEFKVSTLYTALYRMEDRGLIKGRWVEKEGQRRRCYYTLTKQGGETLNSQHAEWKAFAEMMEQIIGVRP